MRITWDASLTETIGKGAPRERVRHGAINGWRSPASALRIIADRIAVPAMDGTTSDAFTLALTLTYREDGDAAA